jgi:membrane protein
MLEKIKHYFLREIWDFSLRGKSLWSRLLFKIQRVLVLSVRGFFKDGCALRASSLTFYTLLSIVPLLALAFAIPQGFGFQEHLKEQLLQRFVDDREVLTEVFLFSDRLLAQAKEGVIAGSGALVLFWSATSLLASMESAFNRIWKVKRFRSWRRLFSDYFAIILITPLLFLLSSSLSLYVAGVIKQAIHSFLGETYMGSLTLFFVSWVPYALLWILYALIYYLLPNTRVRFSSALVGGLIAGALSLGVQTAYLFFQAGAVHYSAIYGSFAAVPLFLIWVQVNWFLLLFGVEISYACQVQQQMEYSFSAEKMSYSLRLAVTIWVARIAVERIVENKPISAKLLVREHCIPYVIAESALQLLTDAGILAELRENQTYLPQCDIQTLSISDLIDALQTRGENTLSFSMPPEFLEIEETLSDFHKLLENSPKNRYIKDL